MRLFSLVSLSLLSFLAPAAFGQDKPYTFTGGVLLGAPINDGAGGRNSVLSSYTQSRWTGGPTVEFHLPQRFSIEFDALYRNNRTNSSSLFYLGGVPPVPPFTNNALQETNVWDFPLLLKYRIPARTVRPFVSFGYTWSHNSTDVTSIFQCTAGQPADCVPPAFTGPVPTGSRYSVSNTNRGIVASGGLEFKAGVVTIAPQLRYAHTTTGYPRENRFTALVGFTFGKR